MVVRLEQLLGIPDVEPEPGKPVGIDGLTGVEPRDETPRLVRGIALVEVARDERDVLLRGRCRPRSRPACCAARTASPRTRRRGRSRPIRRRRTGWPARGRGSRRPRPRWPRPSRGRRRRSRASAKSNRLSPAITSRSSPAPIRFKTNAMSPIAPRRSSFDTVPSSCTVTPPRRFAHSRKSSAKRAFVTSSTLSVTSATRSQTQSSMGRPPTGRSCLGIESVSGRSRVAYPAARMIALMPPRGLRARTRTARGGHRPP